jgi:hypothetical protein
MAFNTSLPAPRFGLGTIDARSVPCALTSVASVVVLPVATAVPVVPMARDNVAMTLAKIFFT